MRLALDSLCSFIHGWVSVEHNFIRVVNLLNIIVFLWTTKLPNYGDIFLGSYTYSTQTYQQTYSVTSLIWELFQYDITPFVFSKDEAWAFHMKKGCINFLKKSRMILEKNIFHVENVLYIHEELHKTIGWVQWMHSELLLWKVCQSNMFSWESYHYYNEWFCSSRGSFKTMVT